MRRKARIVRNIVIAAFLVAVAIRLAGEFLWPACDTDICCVDCTTLPVTRVIDGDTFVSGSERVRLFGVDTPEVGDHCASEATERLRKLAGGTVRVEGGPRTHDTFGRLLYYMFTKAGESIDEMLLREGLGKAWTRDGQHIDLLVAAEQEAKGNGDGCLWR